MIKITKPGQKEFHGFVNGAGVSLLMKSLT